jgi:pilus assembly protein TadC
MNKQSHYQRLLFRLFGKRPLLFVAMVYGLVIGNILLSLYGGAWGKNISYGLAIFCMGFVVIGLITEIVWSFKHRNDPKPEPRRCQACYQILPGERL